jgi:alkanesulfonate monooxygenase SsuD/methylene tetrahydromethanopterin reductase-like flavin-dependent oxidoreductase (luciferase family)
MKLGIYLFSQSSFNPNKRFDVLIDRVKRYDEIGIESLWISDGLFSRTDPSIYPHYETYSLIAAMSQHTTNIKFGTLVSPFRIRPVTLYSKMLMTLDQITKGRVIAGIGLGTINQIQERFGFKKMTIKEQFEEFESYIVTLKSLFKNEKATNKRLKIDGYPPNPLTYTSGGPKLLIGGGGEKKTLQLVAKYADMSNIEASNEVLEHKLNILANWCDEVGRKYEDIENTAIRAIITGQNQEEIDQDIKWYINRFEELGRPRPDMDRFKKDRLVGTVDEVIEQITTLKDLGISHLILTVNTDNTRNSIGALYEQLKNS